MTDQWIPSSPCAPVAPPDGLPPANTWTPAAGCSPPPGGPSIVGGVIINGVPAMIVAPYAWGITLNDGSAPPNFSIDHFDSAGALIESPIAIDGTTGDVTVTHDPTQPLGVATKDYVDTHSGVTEAPADGQLYGRQNERWTVVPPSPIAADAPNDGQAYVRQSLGWAALSAQLTGYMPISGGAFTGTVTFPANNSVLVAGAAGSPRAILGVTGNSARWQMLLGDTTAESGSNAGSNFALNAISDTGALLSTPLSINRQYGNITVPGLSGVPPLAINGISGSWRAIQSQTNGSPRWQMYLADPSGELGSNAGSNFVINRYSDAGAILGSALNINRASGAATFSALPSFPGGAAGNVLSTNGAGALSWIAPSAGGVPEAPTDGQQYARQNAAWSVVTGGGGGLPDAPNDGTAYARKSAGWAHLTHTDITDWTATLAPYALTANVPVASATAPLMNGTAAAGSSTAFSRGDHIHPSDTSRAPLASPAFTGTPSLPTGTTGVTQTAGNSSTALATTAFVSAAVIGDNRIINGDMRIDQRNNGASGTANGYTLDRWEIGGSQASRLTWGRNYGSIGTNLPAGFPYCWGASAQSTFTLAAADYFCIAQAIEADMVSDFAWGTANAQPVTLSFWAMADAAGAYSGAVQNYAATRSYPFTFSLPTANTWTKIVIAIPGDTGGTWVMSGNAGSLMLDFDLGTGATYRGAANAWASANYVGATGAQSIVTTTGRYFYVTGVKLEIGSVATPFNRQSLAKSLADCQRYYWTSGNPAQFTTFGGSAGGVGSTSIIFPTMRVSPTATAVSPTYGNATAVSLNVSSPQMLNANITQSAGGFAYAMFVLTLNAEL